jgi:hypothetical protein
VGANFICTCSHPHQCCTYNDVSEYKVRYSLMPSRIAVIPGATMVSDLMCLSKRETKTGRRARQYKRSSFLIDVLLSRFKCTEVV